MQHKAKRWCVADPGSFQILKFATIPDQRCITFVLHRVRETIC
jgi:hypothetical protein